MLPVAALTALAFSSGGGEEGRQGSPTAQSCDAIYVCNLCAEFVPGMPLRYGPPDAVPDDDEADVEVGTSPTTSMSSGELLLALSPGADDADPERE